MALFTVSMDAVSVSAAQDLWHIKAGATNPLLLHAIELNQKGLTAVEAKEIQIRRHITTVTQGSGGTTPTPQKAAPGGAASGVTAHMNDTTPASAGTITTVLAMDWQFLNGLLYLPPPEQRLYFDISTGIIIKLPTAPSGAMTVSGYLIFEELGL